MKGCALHVQAGVWDNHHSHAALFMEGEAPDRRNGGGLMADALYRAVLARGLHLTTDLDHLDARPVHGWWVSIDDTGALTLEWPRFNPLLEHAPVDLPEEWRLHAKEDGYVILFAGYELGMCEHAEDGDSHPLAHLEHAAECGALASGVVPLRTAPKYEVTRIELGWSVA
jgi:hypothetical protein